MVPTPMAAYVLERMRSKRPSVPVTVAMRVGMHFA